MHSGWSRTDTDSRIARLLLLKCTIAGRGVNIISWRKALGSGLPTPSKGLTEGLHCILSGDLRPPVSRVGRGRETPPQRRLLLGAGRGSAHDIIPAGFDLSGQILDL